MGERDINDQHEENADELVDYSWSDDSSEEDD